MEVTPLRKVWLL